MDKQLQLTLPDGVQTIEAAGFIDLGAGASLCRFYTADDGFIQLSTTGGYGVENIDDIKLFVFDETHAIASQKGADYWSGDHGLIGQAQFQLHDRSYRRAWDAQVNGKIEPVCLTETVYKKNTEIATYEVEHLAMLYQRPINESERYEYLLASLEFSGENEATAVISLGIDVEQSSMQII